MSRRTRSRSRSVLVEAARLLVDAGRWTGHAAIRLARWSGKQIRRQARRWYRAEQAAARRRQAEQRAAQRAQRTSRRTTAARAGAPRQRPSTRAARPPDLLASLLDAPPGDTLQERLINSRPQTPAEARVWAEYIGRYSARKTRPRRRKPVAVGEYAKADGTKVSSHRRATPGQGG